jgi:hypothetical protein
MVCCAREVPYGVLDSLAVAGLIVGILAEVVLIVPSAALLSFIVAAHLRYLPQMEANLLRAEELNVRSSNLTRHVLPRPRWSGHATPASPIERDVPGDRRRLLRRPRNRHPGGGGDGGCAGDLRRVSLLVYARPPLTDLRSAAIPAVAAWVAVAVLGAAFAVTAAAPGFAILAVAAIASAAVLARARRVKAH